MLAFCHCSSSATSSADIKFFSHSLLPEHRGYKVKETFTSAALLTAVLFGQFRCWPGLKSVRIILKRNSVIYFQPRKRIQAEEKPPHLEHFVLFKIYLRHKLTVSVFAVYVVRCPLWKTVFNQIKCYFSEI